MKRVCSQWFEPAPELPPPSFQHRKPPTWSESYGEQAPRFTRAVFTPLRPTAKKAPLHPLEGTVKSSYHTSSSSMPKFRRHSNTAPVSTSNLTYQKQQETNLLWLEMIFSLATYSGLFTSTSASSYREQHLEAAIKNFNSQGVRRHIQIWQQFQDWCKPLGFHPAGISIPFLLDFLFESSKVLNHNIINTHSLLKSFRFIATQADVFSLKQRSLRFTFSP